MPFLTSRYQYECFTFVGLNFASRKGKTKTGTKKNQEDEKVTKLEQN